MAEISPEAQSMIDRFARMDLANPRRDKLTIEQALLSQLEALALPARPFLWIDDPRSACRLVAELEAEDRIVADAARDSARRAVKDLMRERNRAWRKAWTAACLAGGEAIRIAVASVWDAAWDASWSAAWGAAWNGEWAAAQAACTANGLVAFNHPSSAVDVDGEWPVALRRRTGCPVAVW